MIKNCEITGEKKSKVRDYMERAQNTGYRKEYMNELNRMDVSSIIRARARMLQAKKNYKGKYKEMKCRFCKIQEETQIHLLQECNSMNREKYPEITIEDIFTEDTPKLKQVAKKLQIFEKELSVAPAENSGRSTQ